MLSNTSLYASSMQYYFLQMNVRYTINTFDTRYRNIEIKCQIRSLNVLCRYRFSSFLVMDTIFLLKYRHWFILPVLHENKDIHVLCRQHCALPIRKFLVIKNRFHIDVMTFQGFIKHKNNDSFEKGICNTICSSIPYDIILYITNIRQFLVLSKDFVNLVVTIFKEHSLLMIHPLQKYVGLKDNKAYT